MLGWTPKCYRRALCSLILGCCLSNVVKWRCCLLSVQMSPDCKVIILPKEEVDKANKDKKKHYPPNFQVSVLATPLVGPPLDSAHRELSNEYQCEGRGMPSSSMPHPSHLESSQQAESNGGPIIHDTPLTLVLIGELSVSPVQYGGRIIHDTPSYWYSLAQ